MHGGFYLLFSFFAGFIIFTDVFLPQEMLQNVGFRGWFI